MNSALLLYSHCTKTLLEKFRWGKYIALREVCWEMREWVTGLHHALSMDSGEMKELAVVSSYYLQHDVLSIRTFLIIISIYTMPFCIWWTILSFILSIHQIILLLAVFLFFSFHLIILCIFLLSCIPNMLELIFRKHLYVT